MGRRNYFRNILFHKTDTMNNKNKKKRLPLAVLRALEPFVHLSSPLFEVIPPGDNLLSVRDLEEDSPFYFRIDKIAPSSSTHKIIVSYCPANPSNVGSSQISIELKQLSSCFGNWVDYLKEYESTKSFYDDPILKAYEESYFDDFKIIEEDADILPFEPDQALLLDKYFEKMSNSVEKHRNEEDDEWVTAIQEDIQEVRNNLTKKPKNWVLRKTARLWAMFTKEGIPLMKEFVVEGKKELIGQGVKWIIEKGAEYLG